MTSPNGTPRHLHDLTAEMPAIRQQPRHAAPPTEEQPIWRPKPPVPDPVRQEERRQPGWWARFKGWLLGEEQWR